MYRLLHFNIWGPTCAGQATSAAIWEVSLDGQTRCSEKVTMLCPNCAQNPNYLWIHVLPTQWFIKNVYNITGWQITCVYMQLFLYNGTHELINSYLVSIHDTWHNYILGNAISYSTRWRNRRNNVLMKVSIFELFSLKFIPFVCPSQVNAAGIRYHRDTMVTDRRMR